MKLKAHGVKRKDAGWKVDDLYVDVEDLVNAMRRLRSRLVGEKAMTTTTKEHTS